MRRFTVGIVVNLAALMFHLTALAQTTDKRPIRSVEDDWRAVAARSQLSTEEIDQLARDKILVTNETFRQVFTPYVEGGKMPLFITSDSLLNAFHVLFEASILRWEQANARQLGGILRKTLDELANEARRLRGKSQMVEAAARRATIIVAIAMQLLGEKPKLQVSLADIVKKEIRRVEAADGAYKPEWLGPPDPRFLALDYSRYKPRGIYTRTRALERYFRAIAWLQSIPFRIDNDEELAATLILQRAVSESFRDFYEMCEVLVGPPDELTEMSWDTSDVDLGNPKEVRELREKILLDAEQRDRVPQINDQLSLTPDRQRRGPQFSLRIRPALRTPDALLIERTMQWRPLTAFPKGLEVCAMLGSRFALAHLASDGQGKVRAEIDRSKALLAPESLYCSYLKCLGALVAKPEPEAPAFMSTEAWQIKSCQTVLGGWSQMRHTWTLQAKQNMAIGRMISIPTGFVEPVPEFYSRFGALIELTTEFLKHSDALKGDPAELGASLRKAAALLEDERRAAKTGSRSRQDHSLDDCDVFSRAYAVESSLFAEEAAKKSDRGFTESLARLRKLADELDAGRFPSNQQIAEFLQRDADELRELWSSLAIVCRRLESLAHKQLRGTAFSDEENDFVAQYGDRLGNIMLYGGNSYHYARDDAPRIIDVYSNPNVHRYLEVGVSRPRTIYVLYPFKGREVFCRGAVMPYYEFGHDSRLTDAEWKTLIDSKNLPKQPQWLRPILSPGRPSPPKSNTER